VIAAVAGAALLATAGVLSAPPCDLTLTRQAPSGACALPPGVPVLAEVRVTPLDNAAHVPVNLRIAFEPTAGPQKPLAPVSLYPADRAGTFLVRLPRDPGSLVFTLIADPRPLSVRVGPIVWRTSEP
jgi:hypothetical protein